MELHNITIFVDLVGSYEYESIYLKFSEPFIAIELNTKMTLNSRSLFDEVEHEDVTTI